MEEEDLPGFWLELELCRSGAALLMGVLQLYRRGQLTVVIILGGKPTGLKQKLKGFHVCLIFHSYLLEIR